MTVTARVSYRAGGWPGEVHKGETMVVCNVEDNASTAAILDAVEGRARRDVAARMCMPTSAVQATCVDVEELAGGGVA